MPRTDPTSLGKFAARLVTGNPITEDISPIAKGEGDVCIPDGLRPSRRRRNAKKTTTT